MSTKLVQKLDRVVIRFAGDSGDGMQLTGDRFTSETALLGNDLSTLPNFPAEIRAPQGTLPGVSSFQLHFADHDVLTPGDAPDVLVAMNPAALRANIDDLPRGASSRRAVIAATKSRTPAPSTAATTRYPAMSVSLARSWCAVPGPCPPSRPVRRPRVFPCPRGDSLPNTRLTTN